MNRSVFRDKAVDQVSSPEQLNDYIRVTSPGVWIVLVAAALLLAASIIWATLGTVEYTDSQGNVQEVHPITFVIN